MSMLSMQYAGTLIGREAVIDFPDSKADVRYTPQGQMVWHVVDSLGHVSDGCERLSYLQVSDSLHFLNWIEKPVSPSAKSSTRPRARCRPSGRLPTRPARAGTAPPCSSKAVSASVEAPACTAQPGRVKHCGICAVCLFFQRLRQTHGWRGNAGLSRSLSTGRPTVAGHNRHAIVIFFIQRKSSVGCVRVLSS
ncbi:hypothetical protein ACHFCA_22555 [Delftia tsuruhatensis]